MSDWTIFAVGLFASLLLGGGLAITVWEFHRLGKSMEREERVSHKASVGDKPRERAA